jgi:hypothetical protein
MLRLVILLAAAGLCAARYDHCCSAADRHTVQQEWNDLWHDVESAKLKTAFGRLSILKLAEKYPELKEALKVVDIENPTGGRFSVYSLRVLLAFDNIILLLDDPEALEVALETLAERWSHRKGANIEHFKTFGDILNTGLHHLIEDYDPMAWKSCFSGIFKKIASRLQQ